MRAGDDTERGGLRRDPPLTESTQGDSFLRVAWALLSSSTPIERMYWTHIGTAQPLSAGPVVLFSVVCIVFERKDQETKVPPTYRAQQGLGIDCNGIGITGERCVHVEVLWPGHDTLRKWARPGTRGSCLLIWPSSLWTIARSQFNHIFADCNSFCWKWVFTPSNLFSL